MLIVKTNRYSFIKTCKSFVSRLPAGKQTNPSSLLSSLQQFWLSVWSWHCVREAGSPSWFFFSFFFAQSVSPLWYKDWASPHPPCALHRDLILSPHQRCSAEEMISMIKPLSSAYIAMSPDYKSTPHTHTCSPPKLAANFPTPSLCVPCISAEGREHYTGQRCISGPLPPPSSSLIRVSSSTLITESSKEGGQRKLLLHLQEKNQKVDKKQKKNVLRPADVL